MQPEVLAQEFTELRTQSQRTLTAFLEEEISLGLTFAAVASTEKNLGNEEHFQLAKGHAQQAAAAVRHFLGRVENAGTRTAITQQCDELEKVWASL